MEKRLDDYSEPLPVSGWERLEKDLSVSKPPVAGKRRIIPFRRWAVASVVGRDIHSYHFNFPVGVGDAFYQNGLFVSIGAEFCHCFSQFSKSGSCSSGWNQRQSPSM